MTIRRPPPARTARSSPGSWPRFLAALAGLVVVAVAIPAALIAVSQLTLDSWHPIPGIGSVDEIRAWLGRELTSTEVAPVVLRVLLTAAWLIWLSLMLSVLSALTASRPTLERIRLPHLTMFDGVAGWIAAGLTALSSLTPNLTATGGDGTAMAAAVVVAEVVDATCTAPPPVAAQLPARSRVGWERVQHGESIEMFAARTLHAADRWPELWEINQQRMMDDTGTRWSEPWRLTAGWELELPTDRPAAPADMEPDGDGRQPFVTPQTPRRLDAETHIVVTGDTLWQLAIDRLTAAGLEASDEAVLIYVNEIVAANPEFDDPDLIHPSQRVVLPAVDIPSAAANKLVDARLVEPLVHVFEAGDTLWDVLYAYYGYVDAELIWEIAERNGLENPSDIAVGTAVTIAWPPANLEPVAPSKPPGDPDPRPTTRPTPPPEPERRPRPSPTPIDVTSPAIPRSAPAVEHPPPPTATSNSAPPTTPTPTSTPSPSLPDESGLFETSPRTLWWQIPTGLLLAAGLTVTTRRLRARRFARLELGERLPEPPEVAEGTELAVASTGATERLSTLKQLLRTLTPYLREQADPAPVRAVQVDADRIEVLFTAPAPFPPPGWTTINGGASWVHRLDDVPAPTVRQLVTPALVTLGLRADGGELLLDLETAGSLAITGDRTAALGVARAIALELATYPLGVGIDVCPIGLDVDGLEDCDRAWKHTTMTRAVRVAGETLERTASTGEVSLVAARAVTDDDDAQLDPQVFLVDQTALSADDGRLLDELVELCSPQCGAAVVVVGGHPKARERLHVTSTEQARWCDAELRPQTVDREAAAQVAVMFDHAANAPAEPLTPLPAVADHLADNRTPSRPDAADAGADGDVPPAGHPADDRPRCQPAADDINPNGDASSARHRYQPAEYDVLVQVLGDVIVQGRPVTAPKDVELLALLTCLRHRRPNVDTIGTILEWDNPVHNLRTKVSGLRRVLGCGADGQELLPSAAGGNGEVKGRYRVSTRVLTDVELIDHRYHTAVELPPPEALSVLRDGLELFKGPAFQGVRKGYGWVTSSGVQARIAAIVNNYAGLLMQLAFDADDLPLVLEAVGAAGRVIDDPVLEYPTRELERQLADASGDPALRESVIEARRRAIAHAEEHDRLLD